MRAVWAILLFLAGCQDLRDFRGPWHGDVSADPALSVGAPVTLDLAIMQVDHTALSGNINGTDFQSLIHGAADALAEVRVGPDALRSYFGFLATGELAIVSLFPDRRVEVRLIKGDSLYGVYYLSR